MKTKDTVRELLDSLPDDCTLDDVLYQLYVVLSVDRGLRDIEDGRTISQQEVVNELRRKWQTGTDG